MAQQRVTWLLDVVGEHHLTRLLAEDRKLQTALRKTDAQWDRTARSAVTASDQMTRALSRVTTNATGAARATTQVGAAAIRATRGADVLATSQTRVASALGRSTAAASANAAALERLRREQTAAAAAQKTLNASVAGANRIRGWVGTAGGIAGAGAAFGLAALARQPLDYEEQLAQVRAVAGATRAEMIQLDRLAQELGAKTSFSASEAASAMGELAKAGFTARQMIQTLPGTMDLAAASGTNLAEAAVIQSDALRGFQLPAKEATHVADVLAVAVNRSAVDMTDLGYSLKYMAPIAATTGQSFEDMAAALAILGNVGIRSDTAGTTLRRLMTSIVKPTQFATDALAELGLTAQDLQGPEGLLPLPDIIAKIVAGAEQLPKADRLRVLTTIFGRESISGITTLVDKGAPAIRKLAKEMRDADGAADRMARTMQDNLKAKVEQITGALETGAIRIFQEFSDELKTGSTEIADAIAEWTDNPENIEKVTDAFKTAGTAIGDAVEAAEPALELGIGLLKVFTDLPSEVKSAAGTFTLLAIASRKVAGSAAVGALTASIARLRGELRRLPGDAAAARTAMATPIVASAPTAGGAVAGRAGNQGRVFYVAGDGSTTTALPRQTLRSRVRANRGRLAGGAAVGGGVSLLGDDPLQNAITAGAIGSVGGPWTAFGAAGAAALGTAILNWIDDNGAEAGERLGRKMAPGLGEAFKQDVVDRKREIDKLREEIADKRKKIGYAEGVGQKYAEKYGVEDEYRRASAQRRAELQKEIAEIEKLERGLGRQIARGVTISAQKGGGRRMTSSYLAGRFIDRTEDESPQARAAGARLLISWTKGMESQGKVVEGTAERLARKLERALGPEVKRILAREGIAATKAFADGLEFPGAVDNARKLIRNLDGLWGELPKHAKIHGGNARDVLIAAAKQIEKRLPELHGRAARLAREDLEAIRAALRRLERSAKNDGDAAADALTKSLDAIGVQADLTGDDVRRLIRQIAGFPDRIDAPKIKLTVGGITDTLKDLGGAFRTVASTVASLPSQLPSWISEGAGAVSGWLDDLPPVGSGGGKKPKRKRAGGWIGHYQAGGLVPAFVSSGEEIVEPDGSSWVVPGRPVAADNVFAWLTPGSAVLTWDGRARVAAGESLASAIANQAPHFRQGGMVPLTPGQMATLAAHPQGGRLPKEDAITMGAIGMQESSGKYWLHVVTSTDDSWGLWMINTRHDANPQYRGWPLTNPWVNARVMRRLRDEARRVWGDPLHPWNASRHLAVRWRDEAARGFGRPLPGSLPGPDGRGGGGSVTEPRRLKPDERRAGLLDDAWQQGLELGRAGYTRGMLEHFGNPVVDATREARPETTRRIQIGGGAAAGGGRMPLRPGVGTFDGKRVANWIIPNLQWARGQGWKGTVSSGYRSRAEQERLWANRHSNPYPVAPPGTSNHEGYAYPRGAVDVSDWQTLRGLVGRAPYPHRLRWYGPKDPVHFSATGHRRGGWVGGFRRGGKTPGGDGQRGGIKAATLAFMRETWARVWRFYGPRATPQMPRTTYTRGEDALFIGVDMGGRPGTRHWVPAGKREVLWPHWAGIDLVGKGGMSSPDPKQGRNAMREVLLHEWAHVFQNTATARSPWKSEGGATAFARIMAPKVYGRGYRNGSLKGDPYAGHFRRVMRELGRDWVLRGQFEPAGGHRRGGWIRGFRRGGLAPATLPDDLDLGRFTRPIAATLARGDDRISLEELDRILGRAVSRKLRWLQDQVEQAVKKGGDARVVTRLQQVLDLIDAELGRRVGILLHTVEERSSTADLLQGYRGRARQVAAAKTAASIAALPEGERAAAESRARIDEHRATIEDATIAARVARTNIRDLTKALRRAQQSGRPPEEIAELRRQLADEGVSLDEAVTSRRVARQAIRQERVERREQEASEVRAYLEALLQDEIDRRQRAVAESGRRIDETRYRLDGVDLERERLGIQQRLDRTADTPSGMLQIADMIGSAIVPGLQEMAGKLAEDARLKTQQYLDAVAAGRPQEVLDELWRAMQDASLEVQRNGNAIGDAMAEAAELVRQAALRQAEELSAIAEHRSTLAELELQRLELEQKLAGTYEAGAVERADFIRQTIVPAIEAEIEALTNQLQVARTHGDAALVRSLEQALAATVNERLEALLEVNEQIEQNTKPRQFGGALGFGFGGDNITDALVGAGNGV